MHESVQFIAWYSAGFAAAALNLRIQDAEAKVVITADIAVRRGKAIQLKAIVDEALINAPTVEHVIVLRRKDPPVDLHPTRELDFYEMMEGVSDECPPEVMDAEDPLLHIIHQRVHGKAKRSGAYLWRVHGRDTLHEQICLRYQGQ